MPSQFPQQFGPYVLERFIAAGGMAEVFLARRADGSIKGPLCVKRMLPEMMKADEYVTMFKDEARLSQRLVHPHIVRVFDSGVVDGKLYMAMEYVDGMDVGSLQRKLRQRGELLGVGHSLRIGVDICAGLHYAHTLGVNLIHRDISPQNILISANGDVKVTDFGIARAAGRETRTQTGMIKGKVPYMAPEQALGQAIDQRVDQFAAGIVLWEMVTGQRLYAEKSDNLNFEKIIRQPPPKPSATRSGIPPIVDGVILRALAKKPDDRYPDCASFQAALSQALSGLGPAAKSDIGPVIAHVLGLPPPELREKSRPRAPAAPPPANTGQQPAAPARRARGGLEVMGSSNAPPPRSLTSMADNETILSADAPTRKTPSAVAAAAPIMTDAEPMRLPTNALMPLPIVDDVSDADLDQVAGEGRALLHDAPTIFDPGRERGGDDDAATAEPQVDDSLGDPPTDPPLSPVMTETQEASRPRTPQASAETSSPRMASATPSVTQPASSPRMPAAPTSQPSIPLSQQLRIPSSPTTDPAPTTTSAPPYPAFAGVLVVGLVLGFGVAKIVGGSSSSSSSSTACPLTSNDAAQQQKAAVVLNAAKDAYNAGDVATADKLVDGAEALSASAGAQMLRGRIALARGDRLGALAHFRCVTTLDPSGEDAAAVAAALATLKGK